MRNLLLPAALVPLLTLSALGAEVDLSRLPAPSARTGLTFAKDIRPLLDAACFRCHGEEKQKADLRLDSLDAVLRGARNGKVVIPGKSRESPLVIAIAQLDDETAMPPKAAGSPRSESGLEGILPKEFGDPTQPPPLTDAEVGLVRAWIDQGAK